MAKLNVVIPVIDVEINGVKYREVDRDAVKGDIVKTTKDVPSFVAANSFYEIARFDGCDDPQIIDEDGDEYDLGSHEYEVYEPITEPSRVEPAKPGKVAEVGQRIKIVAAYGTEGKYKDGDSFVVIRKDTDGGNRVYVKEHDRPIHEREYIIVNYREVKRWANTGELIRIVKEHPAEDDYEVGAEFSVNDTDGDGDVRVTFGSNNRKLVSLSEYAVLEPIDGPAEPKRLTVGDYAKVVQISGGHNYEVGSFVKIVKDDLDGRPYKAEKSNGTLGNYLSLDDVEPATEAEFLAQTDALKVGDTVKLTVEDGKTVHYHYGPVSNGDIGKVVRIESQRVVVNFPKHSTWSAKAYELTKLSAEEIAELEDTRSKFAVGDKVRLISGGGAHPLNRFRDGDIYEVVNPKYSGHDNNRIHIKGSISGFAKPEQLEKLTAEEVAEIERKEAEAKKWAEIGREVNEFKIGDLVQITANTNASVNKVGDFGVIASALYNERSHRVSVEGRGELANYTRLPEMKLIVPVEQRFDTSEGAAA